MIETTYIDMDGVLTDFYVGAHDWMGKPVEGFPYDSAYNWAVEAGIDYENFPVNFWIDLPKYKDADKWMDQAKGKIYIATYHTSVNSLVGKTLWVRKHYPQLEKNIIFIRDKWLLAARGRLLIDDNLDLTDKFIEHGGQSLLVPRPWSERELSI